MRKIMILVGLVWLCRLVGCIGSIAGDWVCHEVSRVRSPDGGWDAVTIVGDAGATTSTTTFLVIVYAGKAVGRGRPELQEILFEADRVTNLSVVWSKRRRVDIKYDEARVDLFRNHADVASPDVVELRLRPTDPEKSLPVEFDPTGRVPEP